MGAKTSGPLNEALAPATRRELLERVEREIPAESADPLRFVGMYADEPELIDFVCEPVMQTRERGQLRVTSD